MNSIEINGNVTIKNGKDIIQHNIPNHAVNNLYHGIISMLRFEQFVGFRGGGNLYLPANSWYIRLGTDDTTTTVTTTTNLTSMISTVANTSQIFYEYNDSTGIGDITYRSIWNAGVITDTINETGLYMKLYCNNSGVYSTQNATINPPVILATRLAVADGNFSPLIPDVDYPIVIDWNLNLSI